MNATKPDTGDSAIADDDIVMRAREFHREARQHSSAWRYGRARATAAQGDSGKPRPPGVWGPRGPHHFSGGASVAGASPVVAGPLMTSPVAANCEPWQGQSQHRSIGFHATMQPICGQVAERSLKLPSSAR